MYNPAADPFLDARRPILLDLFCGAGGAAMGYYRAGFRTIVGVDVAPQPRYPFIFVQADALEYARQFGALFDVIHASPPCPHYSFATRYHRGARDNHPDLIDPTRRTLQQYRGPFVIENVPGAPVRKDVRACGELFGLRVHRHRYFEINNASVAPLLHRPHRLRGAVHNCDVREGYARLVAGHFSDLPDARAAMGIDWMGAAELAQAIPPAYTEYLGCQLLAHLGVA